MKIQAELSSNSYILSPSCRLTAASRDCDWIFSVGGYLPAFKPPSYWPVPPRVGIARELSDVLRVTGEAFFVITPKGIMGGGRLAASFHAGPVSADFEAWASFLINYKPFYFTAEVGIRITVSASFHIGIIHVSIDGTLGAALYLHGPPFGGHVLIDFKLVHVRISFGDDAPANDPISFADFLEAVRTPGLTGARDPDNKLSDAGPPDMVVVTLSAGGAAQTGDATIAHVVGYTFYPPVMLAPSLSFHPFQVADKMSTGVFGDGGAEQSAETSWLDRRVICSTGTDSRPRMPARASPAWQPALQPHGWDVFENAWAAADDSATQQVADLLAVALGWGNLPGDTTAKDGAVDLLVGAKPTQALKGTRQMLHERANFTMPSRARKRKRDSSEESDDRTGPRELPDGRLICRPHGLVGCGYCCVDFSFMDEVLARKCS